MTAQPYHCDAEKPDEDHPRAGWYIKIDEDGVDRVFGPFVTEPHAKEFFKHTQSEHDH